MRPSCKLVFMQAHSHVHVNVKSVTVGNQGGDRRELRAYPSQQPCGHGHRAPAVPGRGDSRLPWADGQGDLHHRTVGETQDGRTSDREG